MCVTFSIILSHLSLSTFTLRTRNGLSPLYLSLSLIYISFLLDDCPAIVLLDSSLGYPQDDNTISGEKKGFIFF